MVSVEVVFSVVRVIRVYDSIVCQVDISPVLYLAPSVLCSQD